LEQLHYLDFTNSQKLPWDSLIGRLLEIEHEHTPEMVRVPRHAPAAVKQAVAALDSFAPDERKVAVKTLAQMNHPAAQAALAAAVQHPMRDVRVAAAFSLAELTQYTDARAVPGLVDALRDESPDVRYSAALALAEICDPSAVPGLIEAMFDITIGARARKACAKALECIGTPEALEAVERWRQ
jgi:HEAT repeat protein